MITNERIALEKWRNEILKERELWESVQTDFSHIKLIYSICQKKMDVLDQRADEIRQVLEMAVQYDRE